jgi:hypothetical protein
MAMIQLKCPHTGEPVDMGECSPDATMALELWSRPVACPHCGEDHPWTSGHLGIAIQALHSSPGASRILVDHDGPDGAFATAIT